MKENEFWFVGKQKFGFFLLLTFPGVFLGGGFANLVCLFVIFSQE